QHAGPARLLLLQLAGLMCNQVLAGKDQAYRRDEHAENGDYPPKQQEAAGFAISIGFRSHDCSPHAPGIQVASTRASPSRLPVSWRLKTEYMAATVKSVISVAAIRPPITARPSGAFCSEPDPNASAIGSIPRIIASAVMMMGRKRIAPASIAASTGF